MYCCLWPGDSSGSFESYLLIRSFIYLWFTYYYYIIIYVPFVVLLTSFLFFIDQLNGTSIPVANISFNTSVDSKIPPYPAEEFWE